ncbi:MAG: hypothetical protein KAT77_02190 [Nanoarchaeota archaeon]|nr:hypothetical protein [Nanoarchaeota archaeon]
MDWKKGFLVFWLVVCLFLSIFLVEAVDYDTNRTACETDFFGDNSWEPELKCCEPKDKGLIGKVIDGTWYLCDAGIWKAAHQFDFEIINIGNHDYVSNGDKWFQCNETIVWQGIEKPVDSKLREYTAQFLCAKIEGKHVFYQCCDNVEVGSGDGRECEIKTGRRNVGKEKYVGESTLDVLPWKNNRVLDIIGYTGNYPRKNTELYNFEIKSWKGMEALEIFFEVTKNADVWIRLYGEGGTGDYNLLFQDKLIDYVVNGVGYNKPMHAVIPIEEWPYVERMEFFFNTTNIYSANPHSYQDNEIKIKKAFLKPKTAGERKFCSFLRYGPNSNFETMWIDDLDDTTEGFDPDQEGDIAGEKACNIFGGNSFARWTGDECCGDDVGETYEGDEGACWKGNYLGENDEVMGVSYDLEYISRRKELRPTLNWNLSWIGEYEETRTLTHSQPGHATLNINCPEGYHVFNWPSCEASYFVTEVRKCAHQNQIGTYQSCRLANDCWNNKNYLTLKWAWDGLRESKPLGVDLDLYVRCVEDQENKRSFTEVIELSEMPKEIKVNDFVSGKANIKVEWDNSDVVMFFEGSGKTTTTDSQDKLIMDIGSYASYKVCSWNRYDGYNEFPGQKLHQVSCYGKDFEIVEHQCSIGDTIGTSSIQDLGDIKRFFCQYSYGAYADSFILNATWKCCEEKKTLIQEGVFQIGNLSGMPAGNKYVIENSNTNLNVYFQSTNSQETTNTNDVIMGSGSQVSFRLNPQYAQIATVEDSVDKTFDQVCFGNVCRMALAGNPPYEIVNNHPEIYNLYFVNTSEDMVLVVGTKIFNEPGILEARVPLQVLFAENALWGCNLADYMRRDYIDEVGLCDVRGNSFCTGIGGWSTDDSGDFDANERNTSKLAVTGANESDPDYLASSCCPSQACWNGTGCVNHTSVISQPQYGHSCIHGEWILTPLLFTWLRDKTGYCPAPNDCLVEPEGDPNYNYDPEQWYASPDKEDKPICIANKQYIADNFCEETDWGTRTKHIAIELLNLVNNTGDITDYTLYCDHYSDVFDGVDLTGVLEYFVGPIGGANTPVPVHSHTQTNAVNNFCTLNYNKIRGTNQGMRSVMATSLNIPINHSPSSFLQTLQISDLGYCDGTSGDGVFNECGQGNDDTLWYSASLNSIIVGTGTIEVNGFGFFDSVVEFFRNPLQTILNWLRGEEISSQLAADYDVIEDNTRLNYFYSAVRAEKKVTGIMEQVNDTTYILIQYQNFTVDMCNYVSSAILSRYPGAVFDQRGFMCNQTGNTYNVLINNNNLPGYWRPFTVGFTIS